MSKSSVKIVEEVIQDYVIKEIKEVEPTDVSVFMQVQDKIQVTLIKDEVKLDFSTFLTNILYSSSVTSWGIITTFPKSFSSFKGFAKTTFPSWSYASYSPYWISVSIK